MSSHPNRSTAPKGASSNPSPEDIRAARDAAALTQTEAASLVHGTLRAWQQWESDIGTPAHRRMHPGLWELFLIKTAAAADRIDRQ